MRGCCLEQRHRRVDGGDRAHALVDARVADVDARVGAAQHVVEHLVSRVRVRVRVRVGVRVRVRVRGRGRGRVRVGL